jgi:hypothetical protein
MSYAYLTATEADALAATIPALSSAWSAASGADKDKTLERASVEVDNGIPYQGRKYAADQVNQFPRVPYDATPGTSEFDRDPHASVWDWDDDANEPVVPGDVLLAVLLQADAILAGEREPRISAQHDGVVYDQTGSVAESYKQTEGPGVTTGLCRGAWVLLRKYRLKSGKLL